MNDISFSEAQQGSGDVIGTFLIKVRYQRNATWQGEIHWIEKDMKQNFRSAMEMIKLADEALSYGVKEKKPVRWES